MNLGAIQNTAAKKELTSPCLLVHYDPRKVVLLFSIASPCCIGAVLRITLNQWMMGQKASGIHLLVFVIS